MRYAKRRDTTHREIEQAFRSAGCLVLNVDGAVDMVVYDPQSQRTSVIDAKTPRKLGGSDRRTDTQKELVNDGFPILFLRSAENAIDQVAKWRGGKLD